jgi:hypothetical protein
MNPLRGTRLGIVTYGCSGGSGTMAELRAWTPRADVVEIGLLDGVEDEQIEAWRVAPGDEDATVVHLRSGDEVTLATGPLLERAQNATARLFEASCGAVLQGCAGPLPEWPSAPVTLIPYHLLHGLVGGAVSRGRVGIVVPSPLHVAPTVEHYRTANRSVDCRAVSPTDLPAVLAVLLEMAEGGADLLVLACFDHTSADLAAARAALAGSVVPVTSSRAVALAAWAALRGSSGDLEDHTTGSR